MPDDDARRPRMKNKATGKGFTGFMLRLFVRDYRDNPSPRIRRKCGYLGSLYGLFANILIFSAKIVCALIFGLGTMMADAINNASDIGMCLLSLMAIKIASKPASDKHPYGSARFEYIGSLIIGIAVIFLAASQIFVASQGMTEPNWWQKDISPYVEPSFYVPFTVMLVSFIVKLSQFKLLVNLGKRTGSMIMVSTGKDARNDAVVSIIIALSLLLSYPLNFNVDLIFTIVVSVFVIYAGVVILKEASAAILGKVPPKAVVKNFAEQVKAYPAILGIHDLEMHTYGHNEIHAYLHADVDSNTPSMIVRDEIDLIERDLEKKTGIRTFIHIDPISIGDPDTYRYRAYVTQAAHEIDADISVNDFRVIVNSENKNEKLLVFDLVLPYDLLAKDHEVIRQLKNTVKSLSSDQLNFDIDVDDMTSDLLLLLNDHKPV